ncbi:hypothetical protein RDI58_001520 [Solanum bulbocastanum]|uniref:Uncharacterized protein n=1 Tax=Solanum bulbocastanum TaxID=147425 RepID=A0AAN8UEH8_SOLBU
MEWKDQAFPEIAYLCNLELSLNDVKIETDNLKIEKENLKIAMENLKIKRGHLSKRLLTLDTTNDLELDKVRIFKEKYVTLMTK